MPTPQELEQSIQRYESYIASDAGNAMLRLSLGDLYHQAGRFDDAISCYKHCLLQDPNYAQAHSRLAAVLISQHQFAQAEESLRALVDSGEQDAALLHNLGLSLYFQQRWEEARKCFVDARDRGLEVASNFAYLARTLHHLGMMTEALDACRRWVELAQDNESKSYLALLYMDDGDVQAGGKLALEVLAQNPQDVDANIVAGSASTERQEIRAARAHFQTALERDKESGRAWLGLGLVHLYEQEHTKAIDALENAQRIYPTNSGIIVTLGWAKIAAKDPAGAEQVFEQALRVDHNFAESHGGLATALAFQQKTERAREEIKLARRLNPVGFGAEFAHTVILATQGKQHSATVVLERLLEQAPKEGMLPLIEQLRIYSTNQKQPKK
jgi:tetratricopeptide (TPR) repeat protein